MIQLRLARVSLALLALALVSAAQSFPPGSAIRYRHETDSGLRASVVRTFTVSAMKADGGLQWMALHSTKADGSQFRLWLLGDGARYILQEGSSEAREYAHGVTGKAVLPSSGAWEHLFPLPIAGLDRVRYLGHLYVRESDAEPLSGPPAAHVVRLRPDLMIGPASNTRQKDETRRYDGSDYELIRLTRDDYRDMADAGINCVRVDAEQAPWAHELGLFYWGPLAQLPYPELLYRPQYLGPALYLDEPAVGTRDYALRPRLEKDPAFRKAVTPQAVLDLFRERFAQSLHHATSALDAALAARKDVDAGDMRLTQRNLYSWETMPATAAWQLSQDPRAPEAMVFEPPGRIGTRRTIPEIDMTYGVHIPPDDPKALPSIIFGFLRGAARATGKSWGVSIYGAVQPADAPFWLTHAYDLGATRFHFWDNYQLAAVPYGECLALARLLRQHAAGNPQRDLRQLRSAAEVAIMLPAGYNLGHVFLGKGPLWGVGELNLERRNRAGAPYRVVMSRFFAEIERCLRDGVDFDLFWDLPQVRLTGYREVIRVRENGDVEVEANGRSSIVDRKPLQGPPGAPPELSIAIAAAGSGIVARARVAETSAPVYYTLGADPHGVYQNARVAWELYGPDDEDYVFLRPDNLQPRVQVSGKVAQVEAPLPLTRPGNYRLRAATVDTAGRTTVVWRPFTVVKDAASGRLRVQ